MNNQFFDNIARCIKKDDKYLVIDGQHRLLALWKAHSIFGLERYDILIGIHNSMQSERVIYQKINQGMKLKILEVLKSMDDGSYEFFNQLRSYCEHYRSINRISFFDALNCIAYYRNKSGARHTLLTLYNLLDELKTTTKPEIDEFIYFITTLYQIHTRVEQKPFNPIMLRSLYITTRDKNLTGTELRHLVNYIRNNDKIPNSVKYKESFDMFARLINRKIMEMRK